MATTISVRLEEDFLRDLTTVEKTWHTDRSEAIRRLLGEALKEWKLHHALEQIATHKMSVGKAAEDCGVDMWEMFALVKEKNIDWTGYSDEDLQKDLVLLQ
jgi:predicted HTH domain antitoxin